MRNLIWFLPLAALTAMPAEAATDRPAWEGVWQGTIGTLPVRVCLAQHDADWTNGSYYYLSKLVPIALRKQEGAGGGWTEHEGGAEQSGGSWTIANLGADRLTGQWRSGARDLRIELSRVPAEPAEGGACGSPEYTAPRVRPARVVPRAESRHGIAYTKLTYNLGPGFPEASIAGFSIREQQPGDRAINQALRVDPAKREGEADYLGCERQQLAMHGTSSAFSYEAEPELLTSQFLSASISYGGDCGGAHPDDTTVHRTFDRKSGRRIDLNSWFTARGVRARLADDSGDFSQLTPALRAVVLRSFRPDLAECREAVSQSDYWDIALGRSGLVFTPSLPHVAQACEEAVSVPFAALNAWLSPAGRQGVARLRLP